MDSRTRIRLRSDVKTLGGWNSHGATGVVTRPKRQVPCRRFTVGQWLLRVTVLGAIALPVNLLLFPAVVRADLAPAAIAQSAGTETADANRANPADVEHVGLPSTPAVELPQPSEGAELAERTEATESTVTESIVTESTATESTVTGLDTPPTVVESTDITGAETIPVAPSTTDATPTSPPLANHTAPVVNILAPTPDAILDIPSTTLILQFPIGGTVRLQVNQQSVDVSQIGQTETNPSTGQITQTLYSIPLQEGKNTVTADLTVNGISQPSASIQLTVRGTPTELTVETVEPSLPADGRSTATVQGQLLDETGNRSNRDAIVTLEASEGEFVGTDVDLDQPGFQVQAQQGRYTARLQSSLEAGMVRLRAATSELEAFGQVEFRTSLHPTLLSGAVNLRFGARGTDYFGSLRDFLPPDGDNSYQLDVRGAAFLTTRLGEWQVTGVYNSDRPLNRACDGSDPLFREQQACDLTYPVYGDSSRSDIIAPSTDQVYFRIERTSHVPHAGSDVLMWGDYSTAEQFATSSQFYTATTRELHGLFGQYNLGNLQLSAFYGNNVQGFQRDALAPDGTSGFYFLSQRLLVPGSENIFLETEELNRPGTVITREQLSRGADYEIDYDRGTLLFTDPILRTDINDQGQVLVRRIIATYQYDNGGDANIYGGRLQYNFSRELDRESWIGATYVRENQGNRQFEVYGADIRLAIGRTGHLIAEYAHSLNASDRLGQVEGSAYRLEATGTLLAGLTGRVYYRSTDAGFANNATTSFVAGQRRYGAELSGQVGETTTLRAAYDHEDNFGVAPRTLDDLQDLLNPGQEALPGSRVDNSLTTVTVGVQQRIGQATLGVDWIHRDRQNRLASNPLSETSDQLRSRLIVPLVRNVSFTAQNELNLSGRDALYPNRTILGVDWQIYNGVTLSVNHQFFTNSRGNNAITSIDLSGHYQLMPNTILNGRFSFLPNSGMAGTVGLEQGVTLAPGLRATLAYEHVFASEFNTTAAGAQFPQPYAVGQSASSLGLSNGDSYSLAVEYTDNPNFQANARFQHRTASGNGSNTVMSAAVLGRISPSLTALVNFQSASASNQRLSDLGTTSTLRVGLAYRDPLRDRFNALLKYEYRRNPSTIPDDILQASGSGSEDHLFALEAIYAPNWRWELYGKFALRNSTTYLASDLVGTSTVTLAQMRATYRLGYRWDVTAEGRWIGQPSANYTEMGVALEAGYYLTPNLRCSAGYSFGQVDDRDFNGNRSAGGFYLGFTVKLDNDLLRDFGVRERTDHDQSGAPTQSATARPVEPLALAPVTAQ